jgi:hypothetical protein
MLPATDGTRRSERICTTRLSVRATADDLDMLHDVMNTYGYYYDATGLFVYSRAVANASRRSMFLLLL